MKLLLAVLGQPERVALRKGCKGHSTGHNRAGGHVQAMSVGKAFSIPFPSQDAPEIVLPVIISENKYILRDIFKTVSSNRLPFVHRPECI